MKLFKLFILLLFVTTINFKDITSVNAENNSGDTLEVQIPKPKFEIFQAWQYGGFWRWDEKDPRFFKEFLQKIHQSLFIGPF